MFCVRVLWFLGMAFLVVDIALAEPRPDFAVNGQVSGTAGITTLAIESKTLFTSMSSFVLTLQGGYHRMSTVKTALDSIATRVSTAGQTLTQAIATLSTNNSGPIATYFDAVTNAISALRALINGGLSSELNTITTNVENYISAAFIDSFNALTSTLVSLSQTLGAMRTAVQSARNAAGNVNPIPVATMRRYVTTRIVSDFSNSLRLLKSDLPILVYIIKSALASLQTADEFLLSITAEAQLRAQDVTNIANTFGSDMADYVSSIKTDISYDLETPYGDLQAKFTSDLEPTLTPVNGFQDLFGPIFSTMESIYSDDTEIHGTIDTAYTAFIQGALALDDVQLQFYGHAVCTALQDLIQVLIENGPNSQFCFSKYAQKVFNMFVINTYDTTDCYRLSMMRFEKFHNGLLDIVRLIVHDIEDFIELLETCLLFNDVSVCTAYLGGEYTTLLTFTTTKRDYLERLLRKEAEASLLRLETCISNSKHLLILDSETMEADIAECKLVGPIVG